MYISDLCIMASCKSLLPKNILSRSDISDKPFTLYQGRTYNRIVLITESALSLSIWSPPTRNSYKEIAFNRTGDKMEKKSPLRVFVCMYVFLWHYFCLCECLGLYRSVSISMYLLVCVSLCYSECHCLSLWNLWGCLSLCVSLSLCVCVAVCMSPYICETLWVCVVWLFDSLCHSMCPFIYLSLCACGLSVCMWVSFNFDGVKWRSQVTEWKSNDEKKWFKETFQSHKTTICSDDEECNLKWWIQFNYFGIFK